MDPLQLGQSVARAARSRLTRRAALASSGVGLATALLNRSNLTLPALAAQDATPTGAQTGGNNEPPEVPAWMRTPGAEASPYGERAPAEEAVVRQVLDPADSFAPLADLHGTLTPNALFYEVHYGGIPAIDPVEHRLMVHGLVERPRSSPWTISSASRPSRSPISWSARGTLLRVAGGVDRRDGFRDRTG